MKPNIINLREKAEEQKQGCQETPATAPLTHSESPPAVHDKEPRPHSEDAKTLHAWEAREFIERPKKENLWLGYVVVVGIALAVLFLFLRNILGALLVLVGGFAFLVQAFRKPKIVQFAVTDKGIKAGTSLHSYEQLQSFWIFMEPANERSLSVQRKKGFGRTLAFPLGASNPVALRSALLAHLPEEEQKPSEFDAWLRRIGY